MFPMPEWVRAVCAVGSLLIAVASLWFSLRHRTSDAQKKAWKELEQRIADEKEIADERHDSNTKCMADISSRLAVLDERLDHAPDKEEISKLYELIRVVSRDVSKLGSEVSSVGSALTGVTRTVDLISTHLMGGNKS